MTVPVIAADAFAMLAAVLAAAVLLQRRRRQRVVGGMQHIRACFDLVPTATADDWEAIAARLAQVPAAIDGFRTTLQEGARQGIVAARRHAEACARQADTWGGLGGDATPFFRSLVEQYDALGFTDIGLRAHLADGADRATRAYAAFGRYLVDEYLPHASEHDGVGATRYALWARAWNGLELDLLDTYAWGWDELHRIERAMQSVAERILPGRPVPEVIDHLEHDPTRAIEGVDAFRAWNQELLMEQFGTADSRNTGSCRDVP